MKKSLIWFLFVIVIFGAVLRLINLGIEPYCGDETLSLDIARSFSSVSELLSYLREVELHPPLYYLILHFWVSFFGITEFAVRSLSLLFGLGCIVLTFFFANALLRNHYSALLAALVVAILPFQIEFSQEARPYIIFCFFAILAAFAVWKHYQDPKFGYLAIYVFSALAGLYLHYSFALILIALNTWWFFQALKGGLLRKIQLWRWFISNCLVFLGFGFWLPVIFYKIIFGNTQLIGLENPSVPTDRPLMFFDQIADNLIWLSKHEITSRIAILIKYIAKAVLLIGVFKFLEKKVLQAENRKAAGYLLWLGILPFAIFLFLPFSVPYGGVMERHLAFFPIVFAVMFAMVISALSRKAAVAMFMIFALSLVPFNSEIVADDSQWDHFFKMKEISEYINAQYRAGDIVIVPQVFFRTDAAHYLREDIPIVGMLPISHYGLDIWNTRRTLGIIENEYHTRISPVSNSAAFEKLDRLASIYKPSRIWLFGFNNNDQVLHQWFVDQGWRMAFRPPDTVFRVSLYSKK